MVGCGLAGGADVVLECTGAETRIRSSAFTARKGGMLVEAGLGREEVAFPITSVCLRAFTIKRSIRDSTGCYSRAVQLIADGKVDASKLITHRFEFTEALSAFATVKQAKSDTLKVIIRGVPA